MDGEKGDKVRDAGAMMWVLGAWPEADPLCVCLQGEAGIPGRQGLAGRKGDAVSG